MASKRALEGQKGDPGMWGNGIWRMRRRNWMVLDHRTERITPVLENITSEQQRCLLGSNLDREGTSKFDFLKKEKKPTKQAAQNVISNGLLKFKNPKIPFKISDVIGSFCITLSPFFLFTLSV